MEACHSSQIMLCYILPQIHDNHACDLKTWNKCACALAVEYIAIDVLFIVIKSKPHLSIQGTNNIDWFLALSVVTINTRLTNR